MAYKQTNPLPTPKSDDAVLSIAAFETGWMQIKASTAIAGLKGLNYATSWRFFIQHAPSNTKFWFDLGVSHDLSMYPPRVQRVQHKVFVTTPSERDPAQDVISIGADPNDVKYIIARYGLSYYFTGEIILQFLTASLPSHAHWDHIFPAASFFPNAKVLCGAGTLEWASKSWPSEADSTFDGRIWHTEKAELPIEEVSSPSTEPEKWQPLGPFKNAYDFFGDGSFWLIDAPGHCPGNLAALARVKRKDGKVKWAFLGGDCFHSSLFVEYPEAPFGKGVKVTPTDTYHENEDEAREIIRQAAELKKGEGENALIWIAHTSTLEDIWNF
ncbi:hypothetical protein BGW36DRAFT_355400 [Talaromyces proteolyticus]|uniref:Metallo-beta-lactamase domain-containing protein n=1 Tax=Talaromyces proteolyticus TaxID=1131652 RepID=A0AAD4KYS4_9EURO|nr:uncharacterized protein BGW36DRAFT_355400 [Talaromyces proteolyticus]KAH8704020.1 hypothetical protein BGW36DRAFT_355400 [Talaromyces proteolyticus]